MNLVDVGSAVVSVTPQSAVSATEGAESDFRFVATYRCQQHERRLAVAVRTMEGEFGDVLVTVVSNTQPKSAKVLKFPLKALSLHTRIHILSSEEESRPRNRIKFSGITDMIAVILHSTIFQDQRKYLFYMNGCCHYFQTFPHALMKIALERRKTEQRVRHNN